MNAHINEIHLPAMSSDRADLLRRARTYLRAYRRVEGDDFDDVAETIAALSEWIKELER